MSNLVSALEQYPNLANRALIMLLEDKRNSKLVKEWIAEQAKYDVRFARLGELAGVEVSQWEEKPRKCTKCGCK